MSKHFIRLKVFGCLKFAAISLLADNNCRNLDFTNKFGDHAISHQVNIWQTQSESKKKRRIKSCIVVICLLKYMLGDGLNFEITADFDQMRTAIC